MSVDTGNVRELQAVLMRAAVLGDGERITGADIRAALPGTTQAEPSIDDRVLALLASSGEVPIAQVMAALRIPRTTAWRALTGLVASGKLEASGMTKGRRYWLASPNTVRGATDRRWGQVMALVHREGRVTRQSTVEVLAVPERTAGRLLAAMAEAGVLVPDGRGRALGYVAVG